MAVTTTTTRHSFSGTGASFSSGGTPVGQGPFSINFVIIDATHIQIYWTKGTGTNGTPISSGDFTAGASGYLVKDVHYTVQNAGSGSNASITWVESGFTVSSTVIFPTSNDTIVITRNVPLTQITNYQNNASIDAETIEQSFDKLTQTAQQLDDGKDYSFKIASNIAGASGFNSNADTATTLDVNKANRLNKGLKFDANGDIGVSTFDPDAIATTADTYRNDALDHRDTAEDYATRTAGTVRHFDGAVNNTSDSSPSAQAGVYSSKEYAQGTQASTGGSAKNWASQLGADVTGASSGDKSAKSWAIETGGTAPSAGSAKEWAQETSSAVDTTFSAKEYAQGTQSGTGGSSKNWATQTGADVTGASSGDMSAKEWAVGTLGRGVANEGSSKDWATYTSGTVDDADYSAKYWALDAEQSKLSAKASASAVANVYDNFSDTFLGSMADGATASSGSANGTWSASSSSITLASTSGTIEVGQEVTGTGIPADANVLSIDGSTIVISENMTNAGSSVSLTFTGQGVYGAFNGSKDGPSTDNDGDALSTGDLYFNTTDNEMRIYDGANWIAASASGSTSFLIYKYVASGSQTTFTGNDANGASLSYTTNNIIVFLNGIKLDASDFTATSGTSVVLGSGATASDELVIVAFKSFTTADMVPASTGGTFSGNVTFSGTTTLTGTITANGGLETDTNSKIKQKGAFMQSSTHQALVLGG